MTESIENLIKGAIGNAAAGSAGSNILGSLFKVAESQGGVQTLLGKLAGSNSAISSQLGSWIGTGANQPVTGDQVEQTLGTDTVAQVAQHAGGSTDEVKSYLATALPQLVDQLTPGGQLPDLSQLSSLLGKFTGH